MSEPNDPNAQGARPELEELIADVIQRRGAGEDLGDQAICAGHAELMPELGRRLKLLAQVREARAAAQHEDALAGSDAPTVVAGKPAAVAATPLPFAIDGYEIGEAIARGGQATVYRALETRLGVHRAIKVFHAGASLADIERSAHILANLEDERRIVGILGYGKLADGRPYLITNYIRGRMLSDYLRDLDDQGPGRLARLVRLFLGIARLVAFAHGRGVIHRDIKPTNILVESDAGGDVPYLLDFDLVRTAASFEPGGRFIGSLPWAAPEQAAGQPEEVDTRSDIYSLGFLLYHMITGGRFPYAIADEGGKLLSAEDIRRKIIDDPPIPPGVLIAELPPGTAGVPSSIPEELERIILRCLAKRKDDRYASADALVKDLAAYLAGGRSQDSQRVPDSPGGAAQPPRAPAGPAKPAPSQAGAKRRSMVPIYVRVALALIVACALGEAAGWLAPLENLLYDVRVRHCQYAVRPPTTRIMHVDIDDGALTEIGADPAVRAWPWPRSIVARMVDEIAAAGPKVILLDVLFSENSRREQPPGTTRPVDHDQALGEALARAGNVIVGVSLTLKPEDQSQAFKDAVARFRTQLHQNSGEISRRLRGAGLDREAPALEEAMREAVQAEMHKGRLQADEIVAVLLPGVPSDDPLRSLLVRQHECLQRIGALRRFAVTPPPSARALLPASSGEIPPILEVSGGGALSGFADYTSEGGVVRAVPLLAGFRDGMYPHLSLALACALLDADLAQAQVDQDRIVLPTPRGAIAIPVATRRVAGVGEVHLMLDVPYLGRRDQWESMYDYPRHAAGVNHRSIAVVWDAVKTHRELDQARDDLVQMLPRIWATQLGKRPGEATWNAVRAGWQNDARQRAGADLQALAAERDRCQAAFDRWKQAQQTYDAAHNALAADFSDRAVLVGWAATSVIADSVATPLHARCPGVVVIGAVANGILTGELWTRLPWWGDALVVVGAGLLALLVCVVLLSVWPRPLLALVAMLALMALFAAFNGLWCFDRRNIIVPAASPLVCMVVVAGVVALSRFRSNLAEQKRLAAERDWVTRRFGRYTDPALIGYLTKHRELLELKGERRYVTAVFTDLAGFTALTEQLRERAVDVLNTYVSDMIPVIRRHQGYLNKLLGDGMLFFFGAPETSPADDQARGAVASLIEMQARLEVLNDAWASSDRPIPALRMRAGVASGPAIVGDAGPEGACDYTVLGDGVNIAARLEAANKTLGTDIVVDAKTAELVNHDYLVCNLQWLALPGRAKPVSAAWVMGTRAVKHDERDRDPRERFVELVQEFCGALRQRRAAEAKSILEKLRSSNVRPALVHFLGQQAEEGADGSETAPFRITEK